VTEAGRAIHDAGMTPVCIGGGHDLTYPAVRALSQFCERPVGGLNLDAHLDVREEPGSGMPFRALILGGFLDPTRFCVAGAARFAHSEEHYDWLTDIGAEIIHDDAMRAHKGATNEAFKKTRTGADPDAPAFVTIDLDAIDGSQTPGVSAVNPLGLNVAHAIEVARRAGSSSHIRHFDIMELNPEFDLDGRTSRIAALLFMTFVAAFEDRWS
jgi:arginase family enzyme